MERYKQRITLKDIANKAGVSIATASIVLNGRDHKRITQETVDHVIRVAEELHYRPDLSAQMLKGKSSNIIGLVIPDISNPFYPEMTKGITDRASERGYNVVLFNTDNDVKKEKFAFDTLTTMRVAGIILCGIYDPGDQEQRMVEEMGAMRIPVVQIDRHDPLLLTPYVSIDNYQAARDMTELFLSMGHRQIAAVTVDMQLHIANERLCGYLEAMEAAQVPCRHQFVIKTHALEMQKADIQSITRQLMECGCTAALFLFGDVAAIECMQELRKNGMLVPENISVAGFDGIQAAGIAGLTTVQQPKYEIGQKAVDMLCALLSGEEPPPESVMMCHTIIQRGSLCRRSIF